MSKIVVPKVSDNYLLRVFIDETLKQSEKFDCGEDNKVEIRILNNVFYVSLSDIKEDGSLVNQRLEGIRSNSELGLSITSVEYHFQNVNSTERFTYRLDPSSMSAIFECSTNNHLAEKSISLYQHLINKLQVSPPSPHTTGDIQSDIFSAHHEVLTKLEGLNASLIQKQQEHIKKSEQEKADFLRIQLDKYEEKQDSLEASFRAKSEQLETTYDNRSKALDEREKEIEDADNTTARRKTTVSMLEEVKERAQSFRFSKSVDSRTHLTFFLCSLLACVGLATAILTVVEINNISKNTVDLGLEVIKENAKVLNNLQTNTTYIWFLYIRAFFGSALFVSSILYLIKWSNSWANRIAKQELDNQHFIRDLNRSHLAVEMCLEWNEKKDGPIPQRLLDSITEGVFKDKEQTVQDISHPADQLASALIRSADKIKLPLGSGELEVSGSKMAKQKVSKQQKSQSEETVN